MRKRRALEHPRGDELVVRCEQRAGRVQHPDVPRLELPEHAQPTIDPVQRRQDVEPAECCIPRPELLEGGFGR